MTELIDTRDRKVMIIGTEEVMYVINCKRLIASETSLEKMADNDCRFYMLHLKGEQLRK